MTYVLHVHSDTMLEMISNGDVTFDNDHRAWFKGYRIATNDRCCPLAEQVKVPLLGIKNYNPKSDW